MLHPVDARHIAWLKALLETASVEDVVLGVLARPPDPPIMAAITQFCTFDHCGVLVFPRNFNDVEKALRHSGFDVRESVPSVVVKDRLCQRYQISPEDIDVVIVRGGITTGVSCRRELEVFAVSATADFSLPHDLIRAERTLTNETHAALLLDRSHGDMLAELCQTLSQFGYLVPDGCGYNPHHNSAEAGRSALYFRRRDDNGTKSWPRRLELTCAGHHAEVIAAHADGSRMAVIAGVDGGQA
jgi:hypothetical protein